MDREAGGAMDSNEVDGGSEPAAADSLFKEALLPLGETFRSILRLCEFDQLFSRRKACLGRRVRGRRVGKVRAQRLGRLENALHGRPAAARGRTWFGGPWWNEEHKQEESRVHRQPAATAAAAVAAGGGGGGGGGPGEGPSGRHHRPKHTGRSHNCHWPLGLRCRCLLSANASKSNVSRCYSCRKQVAPDAKSTRGCSIVAWPSMVRRLPPPLRPLSCPTSHCR